MVERFKLDNGARVLISPLPHTRSVTVAAYISVGARYESEAQSGISHFIEHMLFKGTARRPTAKDVALAIEGLGGFFSAYTSHEVTNYWVKVAYQHLDTGLDVLSEMLLAPLFAPEEIEKERRVILEEIKQTQDLPEELLWFDLDALIWLPHPLGRDIAGTPETVALLTRSQMIDYMAQHYHGDNLVISVAGLVEPQAALAQVAAAFERLPVQPANEFVRVSNGQHAPRWRVHYKRTEQAHLAVATWAYPRTHPHRHALAVLHTLLGDGMTSRLFQEIREKRGLAYAVSSFVSTFEDCGILGSYAAVDPRNAVGTLEALLHEWARLRDEIVPDDELAKAKELIKGGMLLSMEDTSAIAGWYGRQEALRHPLESVDDVTAAIDAVTAEDVRRVARDLFRTEWLNLAVVGPIRSDAKLSRVLVL